MKEKDIEKAVCRYAEEQGFLVRKYNSDTCAGVPDRIFFGYKMVFLIEFKAPGGYVSAIQQREIKRIRDHGVVVLVVDNIQAGKAYIDLYKELGEYDAAKT